MCAPPEKKICSARLLLTRRPPPSCADGWHRAFEEKPAQEMLYPAAVGGSGLRFILRPATAAADPALGAGYPSIQRVNQGPALSGDTESAPPFSYRSPRMPFGQGRPVPHTFGPAPAATPVSSEAYPAITPFGYPQHHRRLQHLDYENRPRKVGRQDIWQTSSMAMSAQTTALR